jgi:hypothetical protein
MINPVQGRTTRCFNLNPISFYSLPIGLRSPVFTVRAPENQAKYHHYFNLSVLKSAR